LFGGIDPVGGGEIFVGVCPDLGEPGEAVLGAHLFEAGGVAGHAHGVDADEGEDGEGGEGADDPGDLEGWVGGDFGGHG
jgi:hypothetical protein